MKDFIYLVQGRSDLVQNYFHLGNRSNADALFLTYDKPIPGALFFPNSTWAQGRNRMLEGALANGEYVYYVFCDDDIAFKKGGWDELEQRLSVLKPAIAIPVFLQRTQKTPLRWLKYQAFLFNDETLMAFHREVVNDSIVLPYQDRFDEFHWWASCIIQQILIQNFYAFASIQFNDIQINNECHQRYPNPESGRSSFKKLVRDWIAKQFIGKYRDISRSVRSKLPVILWRTLCFSIRRCGLLRPSNYSVSEDVAKRRLSGDSEFLNQYIRRRTSDLSR